MASQSSQFSTASSVPTEVTVGQDDDFVDELNVVDFEYFAPRTEDECVDCDDVGGESVSVVCVPDEDRHYESDECGEEEGVTIAVENSSLDAEEKARINKFKQEGCKCAKHCSSEFQFQVVLENRQQFQEMTREERDVALKTALQSHRIELTSQTTTAAKGRVRPYQEFFFRCKRVCRAFFLFLHGIGSKQLRSLQASLDKEGVQPRVHGNTGRVPCNALTGDDTRSVKTFLLEHAARHALPLPGRLPNFGKDKVLLLPSDQSRYEIYTLYCQVATQMNFRQISYISFYRVWKQQCPYIAIMKPSTDLCQKCQHFFHSLRQGCRLEEEDKAALLAAYSEHVQQSKGQRDHYRQQCLAAKQVYSCMEPQQGPATPCSKNVTMHYSWDFAQQVHLPHHAQQVGPIYFKTPRKIDVFGVCCEGSGKQVFYLVDEAESTGKGANEVISMVHHYFDTHSFGEKAAQIHFDNCGGQNKNNAVLWYALWRVMTGRHETFSYNCMIVGHTKFDPDWHFGLWKVKWRRSTSECMNDVVESVRRSTRQSHNIPQVCKDPHHPVVFFNWKEYLGKLFRPLLGVSKFHHFRTTSAEPGVVYYRDLWDSPELKVNLLKKNVILPGPAEMPEALPTPGMSAEREWYLYQEIRTFCACPEKSDEICPRPTVPRPSTSKKMKIE